MHILGVNQGHNATACLLTKGKIVNCVSEERFSRIKNHYGFPKNSINFILSNNNLSVGDIDYFVIDNAYPFREKGFSQSSKLLQQYTNKSFKNKIKTFFANVFPNYYPKLYDLISNINTPKSKFQENSIKNFSLILGIPKEKIILADHHKLHAFSTCFNLPKNKKTLIFTLDGEGSDLSASVNIWNGKNLQTISKTSKYDSLGYIYSLGTIFLGMKPLEHEFKVMGLAPYSKEVHTKKVYKKLRKLFYIDDSLVFHCKYPSMFIDYYFKKEFSFVRFDNFAAAIQKLTEELILEWIKKAVKKTRINDIALSGGVFMNVKVNQRISELKEIDKLFIMPSAGDESNAIRACFYGYHIFCNKNNKNFDFKPLKHLYLGPNYDNSYIENMIKKENLDKEYIIKKLKNTNSKIAKLLAKGKIVGRCFGNTEWGARALGNRSILANPNNKDTIKILNELIKDRDFWMPFTPSILDIFEKDYVKNPKKISAPYMALTFDSTKKAQKDIPAAMHPYDFTIRPQIVTKNYNSDYYEIIKKFSELTKIGAVLNTSFNLHGEPNILTPEDAIHTFKNSGLNYVVIGDYLFIKK